MRQASLPALYHQYISGLATRLMASEWSGPQNYSVLRSVFSGAVHESMAGGETNEEKGGGLGYQDEHTGTSILFGLGLQVRVMGQINFTEGWICASGCCFIPIFVGQRKTLD